MAELTNLAKIEEHVRAWEMCRQALIPYGAVLDTVVLPLLKMARCGPRWVTFADALRRLDKSKAYLNGPLTKFGGRSRLEVWAQEGLASQNADGLWLISEVALMSVPVDMKEPPSAGLDPEGAAEDLYNQFT